MLILGLDTATVQVSCAVGGHEGVLAATQSSRARRHAETLVPAIEFTCRQARIALKDVSVVAVGALPKAFVRIATRQYHVHDRGWEIPSSAPGSSQDFASASPLPRPWPTRCGCR